MDVLQAALDVSLCRGATVTPAGTSRAPLPIRAGRIGASLAARAWRIDLRDHLIFPGLINAHEHLHVNAVPPLRSGAPFPDSYAWIAAFQAHFAEPAVVAALQVSKELRLRHGALKNLLAGVTCVAHHDPWHAALDATDFPVALLRDYGWSYALGWPDYGPPVQPSFAATPADRPWLIHLAEGTDATAQAELDQLDRLGCLAANSVLVHGVGLRERDVDRVIASGAAVVWCPTSNRNLLGRTLDPRRLHAAGRLALGSDSRLSGARDLLDEMRGVVERGELDPAALLELASVAAARILRLPGRGSLAPGARADLVIVADRGGDPASSLAGIRRSELRAVVRDGVPRIADPDFADWFAAAGVDAVPVMLDGKPKLLAAALAEPALLALEPGLELLAGRHAHAGDATAEAGCR
ncbi:amidohydrolase family protein [Rhodanobacter sp. KK11]|jgi:cytosine/adenosine deaminase-related metal-dependent hydrolase|uniref:amidohydrolase family protein n=1 Tax=Rhodanobacter sp. KK11 TaxID=3083255 RepID=UPI0029662C0B|nr:amidohydrolase family protein [Rhodanobacter sp. KK11]MDW2981327.1 amidohydrolase family protein [Rhodanobacter sp. KK11]